MVILLYDKITCALFNLQFVKTVIKAICMYVMIFLPKSLGTRIIFTCLLWGLNLESCEYEI